ncbi:M56 family metallopeptidase [Paenibacillus oenotherae]|uniref:M56 family metallopeptidase n=1 Tax=Paenibacillus oenotherae TaxID=1435645 RepID=A0ABS7D9D0_9BACL|nr:M56 family metallopeptidase [Paenibacillus oenotherae]MBW7476394.1 M56 family metallopeptidase [Paenibacillus oenotherae]
MLALLTQSFQWILATSLMASVLILFILAAKLLLGERLQPRWTYMLWMLLLARLLLPWTPESSFSIFNFLTPQSSFSVFDFLTPDTSLRTNEAPSATPPEEPERTSQAAAAPHREPAPHNSSSPQWAPPQNTAEISSSIKNDRTLGYIEILSIIWLIGALAAAGTMLRVNIRYSIQLKREPRTASGDILPLFEQCKAELGIRRSVALVESRHAASPALTGVFRPKLLMPVGMMNVLSAQELRHIFVHELCHLKRNDLAVNGMMNVLLVVHWFNPLLWFSYHKLREDQELACDSMVLAHMGQREANDYAHTIIKLLELFSAPTRIASTVAISGSKKELKRRIMMIRSKQTNGYKWSLLGIALMLLLSGCTLTNASNGTVQTIQGAASYEAGYMKLDGKSTEQLQEVEDSSATREEVLLYDYRYDGVFLYGTRAEDGTFDGMTVRTRNKQKHFPWRHPVKLNHNPVPYLRMADVDKDGQKEIIVLLVSSLTERKYNDDFQSEIHVLNQSDLSELEVENPMKAIHEKVTSSIEVKDGRAVVSIDTGDEQKERSYAALMDSYGEQVEFGEHFYYEITEDGVQAIVTGSLSPRGSATQFRPILLVVEYDSALKVKRIGVERFS